MDAKTPHTLKEAITYFADPDNCLNWMVAKRWPNGVTCPACGSQKVKFDGRRWQCASHHPKRKFSLKTGTVLEDSPLGLDKWLPVMWLVSNCKNGLSSWEIHRHMGVTQKTAWFMLQRARLALQTKSTGKLSGEIEADETLIGVKPVSCIRASVRGHAEKLTSGRLLLRLCWNVAGKYAPRS